MGCGDSKPKREAHYQAAEEDELNHIEYHHEEVHPDHVPLARKLDPTERILVKCGGVFITSAKSSKVECLFFYPDLAVTGKGPCNYVTRKLKKESEEDKSPKWTGARVQFKEFDSPDDIYKDWYERPTVVPGLLNNTRASPFGSWATLNPHVYQYRFVLPNGRRMWSPMADSGYPHYSVPQRINRLYEGYDSENNRQTIDKFLKRVHEVLPLIKLALVKEGIMSPIEAVFFEPEDVVQPLLDDIPHFKEYNTIHEILDPELEDLKEILGQMEDNLIYNWFQIHSRATLQIGCWEENFKKEGGDTPDYKKSMWDRALGVAVGGADVAAEALKRLTHKSVDDKLDEASKRLIQHPEHEASDNFNPTRAAECLFPDLGELVEASTDNITAAAWGLSSELEENTITEEEGGSSSEKKPMSSEQIEEMLDAWATADARPLHEKRREVYEATLSKVEPIMEALVKLQEEEEEEKVNGGGDGEGEKEAAGESEEKKTAAAGVDGLTKEQRMVLDHVARVPILVKNHFMPFTFFCVFPFYDSSKEASMHRPNSATLVLWPQGLPMDGPRTQRIEMDVLRIELDKNRENQEAPPAASKLSASLFEGDGESSIDSDDEDDPRNSWIIYDDISFRGFEATANVAQDLTYNFYFELDGVPFLDYDSWSRHHKKGKIKYRRVRFTTYSGHVVMNPIREMGLVI